MKIRKLPDGFIVEREPSDGRKNVTALALAVMAYDEIDLACVERDAADKFRAAGRIEWYREHLQKSEVHAAKSDRYTRLQKLYDREHRGIERRLAQSVSTRSGSRAGGLSVSGNTIRGYASVTYRADDPGSQYEIDHDVFERIAPGAFDRAIKEKHNAAGLFNHNPDHILGRVEAGTLRLTADATGLRYELTTPDTELGRQVRTAVNRGDVKGSSFSFRVIKQKFTRGAGYDVREIQDVELFDVAPVVFPAYRATATV